MNTRTPRPNPWLCVSPYALPRHPASVSLRLDGNEGIAPPQALLERLDELTPESFQRYPSPAPLEAKLAQTFGLEPERVLVSAGGDEGLMRMCRAFLGPGRNLIFPEPSFEMIRRFAEGTQCEVRTLPYPKEGYPTDAVIAAADSDTALVAVVSPNNPTGGVIEPEALKRLSKALPQAMLMVDLAYGEFADTDLTACALELPNALVFRTFSKARGLAGLRVGYVMGEAPWIRALRSVGLPYPASASALHLAQASLDDAQGLQDALSRTKGVRNRLRQALSESGAEVYPSQGNFVFVRGVDGVWWRDAMASLGIAIRAWPGSESLQDAVRISCPPSDATCSEVCEALEVITKPEALLFDLDGVLADVSASYRQAIIKSAAEFGVEATQADIEAIKAEGDANNDWVVTQRLLEHAGVSVSLDAVKARFEAHYQGSEGSAPLYLSERFIGERETLAELAKRFPLGIVTGRPREDAERFLRSLDIEAYFQVLVTMEDAAIKPSPEPVQLAMRTLGVTRAWMLGDTPDDIVAARKAGVLALGVLAPGAPKISTTQSLLNAGAARVFEQWDDLKERLA